MAAEWCGWPGLWASLCLTVGFLDPAENNAVTVHDFHDHAFSHAEKNAERQRRHREKNKKSSNVTVTPAVTAVTNAVTLRHPPSSPLLSSPLLKEAPSELSLSPADSVTQDPSRDIVLVFPCDGPVKEWGLTLAKAEQYADSYPHLDIEAELRAARQWLIDHPTRRKTAKGMPGTLTKWLNRAQNGRGVRLEDDQPIRRREKGSMRTLGDIQ